MAGNNHQSKEQRFNKRLLGALVGGSILSLSGLYKSTIKSRVDDGLAGFMQRISNEKGQ